MTECKCCNGKFEHQNVMVVCDIQTMNWRLIVKDYENETSMVVDGVCACPMCGRKLV